MPIFSSKNVIQGDFFVCEFGSNDEINRTDVFDRAVIRLRNPNPILTALDFYKTEFKIPEELEYYCQSNSDAHKELKKSVEAMSIRYQDGFYTIKCQS